MQKRQDPNAQQENNDMIDKNISFDKRDMHKTWPLVKGCLMAIGGLVVFVYISRYVFKNFF